MIPFVIAAVGALVGAAGTYVLSRREHEKAVEQAQKLEKMQRKLEVQLKQTTERETQGRLERFKLVLGWTRTRLDLLLENKEVSLERLQRLWATSKALAHMQEAMTKNGELPAEDQAFLDIVVRAQSGEKLNRKDAGQMDDYLASKVPDAMCEFLQERMSTMYVYHQRQLEKLNHDLLVCGRELRTMQLRHEVERLSAAGVNQLEARLKSLKDEVSKTELTADEVKRNLVIITRLTRPREEWDSYDDIAAKLLERMIKKEMLSEDDASFLAAYRDTYFLSARETLKKSRNIDLANLEVLS